MSSHPTQSVGEAKLRKSAPLTLLFLHTFSLIASEQTTDLHRINIWLSQYERGTFREGWCHLADINAVAVHQRGLEVNWLTDDALRYMPRHCCGAWRRRFHSRAVMCSHTGHSRAHNVPRGTSCLYLRNCMSVLLYYEDHSMVPDLHKSNSNPLC